MTIRDRIKAFRRVPARELVPHRRNWRQHPPRQAAALAAVLEEIGYADALLVRERTDGRLEIIDGHLRAAATPSTAVPVLVLDVDELEAEKILLTHDPLTSLATADEPRLAELMAEVDLRQEVLQGLLDSFAGSDAADAATAAPPAEREPPQGNSFQVAVECPDEPAQRELFERLTSEGYRCRLLVL